MRVYDWETDKVYAPGEIPKGKRPTIVRNVQLRADIGEGNSNPDRLGDNNSIMNYDWEHPIGHYGGEHDEPLGRTGD